jgi:hypothetical membrane protein
MAAAVIAVWAAGLTVASLAALHVLSPEFDPAWRMVSEYANGDYAWALSLFFAVWGVSSFALAYALRNKIATKGGKIGLALLVLAGLGQVLAAVFDINHPLHNLVGNVAIPSFAVAALLIGKSLSKNAAWARVKRPLMYLSHLAWISAVLLVVSFVILITTYMNSGGDPSAGTAITELPDGVIAFVGWTNRLLVIAFAAWTAAVAWWSLKLKQK